MRYGRTDRHRPTTIGFNATPMVDVIFMLTIFFMLVSTFSSKEKVAMELPRPVKSQAKNIKMPDRVVINCRPAVPEFAASSPALYSVGPNRPESLAVISQRLAAMKADSPNIKVVIRADRRLRYADVRAAMQIVANNNIEMLNVVAHVGEGE